MPTASAAWEHFIKVGVNLAQCKLCQKRLKTGGGTTNLRQHLNHKHTSYFKDDRMAKFAPSRKKFQAKIAVMTLIKENKEILFSKTVESEAKVAVWNIVLDKALKLGLVNKDRDYKFMRDTVYATFRKRALRKRENASVAEISGGKRVKFDNLDKLVYDTVGLATDIVDGEEIPPFESDGGDDQAAESDISATGSANKNAMGRIRQTTRAKRNRNVTSTPQFANIETSVELDATEKRLQQLQIEFLEIEIYRSKLKTLKLEMEMKLPQSYMTKTVATYAEAVDVS